MDAPAKQFTDPTVSRSKFEREVGHLKDLAPEYQRRGLFLVRAEFPEVLVLLAKPDLSPPAVIAGVHFDYTNYDALPPSVHLVNPFTEQPYKFGELPTMLLRAIESDAVGFAGLPIPPGAQAQVVTHQPLMQGYGPEDIPFLCIAGVREYHEHPGHSGDSWELHRSSGAGRLVRLLEVFMKYGVEPISGYQYQLIPKVTGFAEAVVPS